MKKLLVTVEFEYPEEFESWSEAEIRQNLFDSTVNFLKTEHLDNALRWLSKSLDKSSSTQEMDKYISDYHKKWADLQTGHFEYQVVDK